MTRFVPMAAAAARPRRRAPEQDLQKLVVDYLVHFVPPPPAGPWWSAINPIPAKSKAAAGLSKAMGMRAGVPDLLLFWQGRLIGIELKASKGRSSDAQDAMHAEIAAAGGAVHVCRSLDEVVAVLRADGIPANGRLPVALATQARAD